MEIHDVDVMSIIHHLCTLCGKVQFEMLAPLECCATVVGNLLPVSHDNLSVPPLMMQQS